MPIEKVSPNGNQPRKTLDEAGIKELAESIRQHGIIEPLIVREMNDAFQIICGHRRYNAAMSIDLKEVPLIIRNVSDEEALELQVIENLQREDVHPMQQARCNNVACFKNKEVLHVQREIHACVTNPTILLAYKSHSVSENVAKILNDEGIVAHKFGYGEPYREVHRPHIPMWDEFQTQSAPKGLKL